MRVNFDIAYNRKRHRHFNMKQQSDKPKVNKISSLLSQEENEQVFGLLGRRCQVII